jgi:hypothetical protein
MREVPRRGGGRERLPLSQKSKNFASSPDKGSRGRCRAKISITTAPQNPKLSCRAGVEKYIKYTEMSIYIFITLCYDVCGEDWDLTKFSFC